MKAKEMRTMNKVEDYIKKHTQRCSNHVELAPYITGYIKWLTVDDARRIAEIAREETTGRAIDWIKWNNENGGCQFDNWEEDFRKYMKG